jgi:O-antigen/teichoic acid export membrane protein
VRTIEVVAQFGTALLLVWYGYGMSGALGGFAIGTAISLGLAIWLAKDVPFWRSSRAGCSVLAALRPALPFLLANLCGVLLINTDLLAVKFLTLPDQALAAILQAVGRLAL